MNEPRKHKSISRQKMAKDKGGDVPRKTGRWIRILSRRIDWSLIYLNSHVEVVALDKGFFDHVVRRQYHEWNYSIIRAS